MEGNGLPGGYHCPPGFRFHPTDQELILHYLTKMVTGTLPLSSSIIAEIDLYKSNPWDLPCKALFGDEEWFFFSPRDRKYPNGARPNRAAGIGYWKATGTDKPILGGTQCIGVKKALVFYKGRPPKGIKTDWVMHEYRLLDTTTSWSQKHRGTMKLDDWVLCRVRQKGSMGLQGEEKHESSNISHGFIAQHAEIPAPIDKDTTDSRWSDYQLLAYLMGSVEKVGDAACSNSECAEQLGQAQFEDPTDFYSKRTLPFGPLDEILLMPPRKRLNCSGNVGEESSPSDSSIDLVYLD